eukprot:3298075-Rhodomonas_salina.3
MCLDTAKGLLAVSLGEHLLQGAVECSRAVVGKGGHAHADCVHSLVALAQHPQRVGRPILPQRSPLLEGRLTAFLLAGSFPPTRVWNVTGCRERRVTI